MGENKTKLTVDQHMTLFVEGKKKLGISPVALRDTWPEGSVEKIKSYVKKEGDLVIAGQRILDV